MANRDIVVVGGSAGALEALKALLPALPGDPSAAVFVVVHIGATTHSVLPEILSRAGPLPAQAARDGARFERGRIYVAPPDRHLLLDGGRIALRIRVVAEVRPQMRRAMGDIDWGSYLRCKAAGGPELICRFFGGLPPFTIGGLLF
jgi:chemotaxis response regulator CheB